MIDNVRKVLESGDHDPSLGTFPAFESHCLSDLPSEVSSCIWAQRPGLLTQTSVRVLCNRHKVLIG